MIGFYAAGAMGQAGGGGGNLFDAIMTHSPFMYFRLGESTGTVAGNAGTGPAGAYSGDYSLGNAPLYSDGLTSYGPTNTTGRVSFPAASVVSLAAGLTLGVVMKVVSVSGLHFYINRDDAGVGGGSRHWQFRNDGANMHFLQNQFGLDQILRAHGLSAGDTVFAVATYNPSGEARLFKNGSQLGSPEVFSAGLNLGSAGGSDIVVGNFFSYSDAKAGDLYSEAFAIAGVLSPAEIAALAAAGGFA